MKNYLIRLGLCLVMVGESQVAQAENIFSQLFGGNSNKLILANAPAETLFFKKVEGVNPLLAMNDSTLFAVDGNGVSAFNLKDGSQALLKNGPSREVNSYTLIYADEYGAYVSSDNRILQLSLTQAPIVLHTFSGKIRWSESGSNFAIVLTKTGEVAHLSNRKVKIVGSSAKGDLRRSGNYVELYDASSKISTVKRFATSGEVAQCSVSEKVFKLALSNDEKFAIGSQIEGDIPYLVGVDCGIHKIVWKKKIHGEIMTRVQGIDHHFRTDFLSAPANCGEYICINSLDQRITIGGSTESGAYCVDPKSGSVGWKFSHVAENDPLANLNTNIIAPIVCTKDRLLAFRNGGAIIYTQEFPVKVDKPLEYLSTTSQKTLRAEVSDKNGVITNTMLLPTIYGGRLGFVTPGSRVIVIGK